MKDRLIILCFLATLMAGCVMPPLSSSVTGRSNGRGNWSTQAGYSPQLAVLYARQSYGVSDNFDLGLVGETGIANNIIGLWGQYSLLNQPVGWSVALNAGVGYGKIEGETYNADNKKDEEDTTSAYYAVIGPIMSYKSHYIEPYLALHASYLHTDFSSNVKLNHDDELNANLSDDEWYFQTALGTNLWFTDNIGLNISGNIWVTQQGDMSEPFLNAGFVFRY